ncbi:hypothetical protein LSS_23170 [Leptospira santarosai serovar Shermani str. LT 821]|uniref:Uncharacterized protein n=1 Tax=Leptospira santarosai serovar Shermani str. LT 821 TaxID=758847 RepID=A0A097ET22_9LEPT|nr:hypothetical protein LSS_23170 [Leptospira santarosai serovar Shermani str. LT 821]
MDHFRLRSEKGKLLTNRFRTKNPVFSSSVSSV